MPANEYGQARSDDFRKYLISRGMSENTIRSYLTAIRQYYSKHSSLSFENLGLYKVDLIERYRPQTVNQRIRALNCYMEYQGFTGGETENDPYPEKNLSGRNDQPGRLRISETSSEGRSSALLSLSDPGIGGYRAAGQRVD